MFIFLLLTSVTTMKRTPRLHGTICLTLWCVFGFLMLAHYNFQRLFMGRYFDLVFFPHIVLLLSSTSCFLMLTVFTGIFHKTYACLISIIFFLYYNGSLRNKTFAIYTPSRTPLLTMRLSSPV